MSRESIVFVLGLLVVVVPQLGVPQDWKSYFFLLVGVCLMLLGYSLRRSSYLRSLEHEAGERRADSFVESNHHNL